MSAASKQEIQLEILTRIAGKTVLVIGDVMLDRFIYGRVDRISPESPVPVLAAESTETMLGGAGNVVANLVSLGAKPVIVSVKGNDEAGSAIDDILRAQNVDTGGMMVDADRPTICKNRYIGRNQHLLRVDFEEVRDLSPALEEKALDFIREALDGADSVVLSDYGKGVLTDKVITETIKAANAKGVPVIVDPKRADYSIYGGATAITPNRKELSAATDGMAVGSDAEIEAACAALLDKVSAEAIVATRSEAGMSAVPRDGAPVHIRHTIHEVFDVSGAGDTVVAVVAAALGAGAALPVAATLANMAGGIAVSQIGTSQVKTDEIEAALLGGDQETGQAEEKTARHSTRMPHVCADDAAAAQIRDWQAQGLRVGFTNGCFDILHFGHVSYLNNARDKCDRLVVGLNHDQSVRILKGPERPVNDENARAAVIGALGSVDMVVFFGATAAGEDNTPCGVLDILRPDVIFKGGDYKIEDLPEAKVVLAYGGAVDIMPLYEGHSTTGIIEKSRKSANSAA